MEIKYRTEFPVLLNYYNLHGYAVECGVAEGRNSEVLISSQNITKLYMIDNWATLNQPGDGGFPQSWHDNNYLEARQRVKHFQEKAVILKGLSSHMIPLIEDDSLVLGYIDGDHSFEGSLSDFRLIYPKIKSGGILAGHDILNMTYGVNRALKELMLEKGYSTEDIHFTEEDGDKDMVSFWLIKK